MPACVQSSISGKVAIITGASSGIGRGIALDFARHGCRLALVGRKIANLELTKSQCVEQGLSDDSILLIQAELKDTVSVESIVKTTIQKFDQIDILVNNAGIVFFGEIGDFTMEKYHEQMQVNVHSVVFLTKLCVPYLEKSKGCIINVSSLSGVRPSKAIWAYDMTKAALDQFCRSLSLDLAPKGIRVNNVNPAIVVTDIHLRSGSFNEESYLAMLEHSKLTHALGRVGQPAEMAKIVSFLVSDRAEQTTGAIVMADAGRSSMVYQQPLDEK